MTLHMHIFRLQIRRSWLEILREWAAVGLGRWKSLARTAEAMTKTWQRQLEIGNTLHLLSRLTLKDRDSEQHTDNSFSVPPPQVVWSTRRGGRSRHKLGLVLFGLCSTVPLILNSKCRHLKLKSFIHRSDCETCRRFEVLTVTSQMAFSDYRGAKKHCLLSIWWHYSAN